jgi:hypothetical protein
MKQRFALGLALVLLLGGVAFYGLRSARTEVASSEDPVVTPPETGAAVVAFLRESGGFSLLGIRFADSTHFVEVQFITEPGCSRLVTSGDPWPTPYPQCVSPVGMAGEVRGLGITVSGNSLVGVEFEVPRACFELLAPGMAWPTSLRECSLDN